MYKVSYIHNKIHNYSKNHLKNWHLKNSRNSRNKIYLTKEISTSAV